MECIKCKIGSLAWSDPMPTMPIIYYFGFLGFSLLSNPFLLCLPDLLSGIYPLYENWRRSIPERFSILFLVCVLISWPNTFFIFDMLNPWAKIIFLFYNLFNLGGSSHRIYREVQTSTEKGWTAIIQRSIIL